MLAKKHLDTMTNEELRVLDAWARQEILVDLCVERKFLSDKKIAAREKLRDAKVAALDLPKKEGAARVEKAKTDYDRISYLIDCRKDQYRILGDLQRGSVNIT